MVRTETSTTTTFANLRILRRCLRAYVSQARRVWNRLSPSMRSLPVGRAYARHLNRMVRLHADRKQYFATFFLRNRAELQLMCRLFDEKPYGSRVNIAVLACSKGAEVYSIAWAIRSAQTGPATQYTCGRYLSGNFRFCFEGNLLDRESRRNFCAALSSS